MLVVAFAFLVAGCGVGARTAAGGADRESPSGASTVAAGGAEGSPRYDERLVAPFAVLDEYGEPYALPFLGGFNVPRPQFIDIDGDGDLDLFVQERTGELMFFENRSAAESADDPQGSGTPSAGEPTRDPQDTETLSSRTAPSYVWRTDRYQDLDIGEWSRFVDLDEDGDYDLLAEEPYSYVRYFRNEGTPQRARFVLATDSVRMANGEPLFSDRQNIPNLTDIDCDGRLDLFLGRVDGSVTRHELVGLDQAGAPRFELVTERFEGISIVGQILPTPSARHGANSMAFADIDGDGDQDFFWGDYFEPGVLFIENTGTCPAPSLRGTPIPVPGADSLVTSGFNVPVPTDTDGDGDFDLFVGVLGGAFNPNQTAADNLYFYERLQDGSLDLRTRRFLPGIDVGSESIPSFADLDGDGDLDLFLANKIDPTALDAGRIYHFENTGSATAPRFALADTLALREAYHLAPAFGDLDADGDVDLLIGTWNQEVAYLRNEGTAREPRLTLADSALITLTRGSHSTPFLGDLDADGDLDLLVGEASGALNFYRNEGSASAPRFTLVSDEFGGIDVGRRSFPTLVDIEGDGDLDLLVGSEAGGAALYRNDGNAREPRFVSDPTFTVPLMTYSTPVFVDLDADGQAELVSGGLSGGVTYREALRER